ncbi:MAG TPA: metallophosphoesterase [Thermomicrobiales bacterium]|nr:metallophosphoesterase [Thermomicrobiales bacterium]
MNRNGLIRSLIATVPILATLAGVIVYTRRIAPRWLEVVRLRVALPGLPNAWVGLRIAHLSDFHAGGEIPLDFLQHAKVVALAESPNIIALTGDFYNAGQPGVVGDLFTTWPDDVPVFAVLGNHDHRATGANLAGLLGELSASDVEVLRNRAVEINLRGLPAWIVGVDDPFSWLMDEEAAFGALPASAGALLYLAHSPVAAQTVPTGRARLMLSGHTHGGQVRLVPNGRVPFVTLARRLRGSPARPDPDIHRGVHWLRGTVVVISHGLGVSKLPWRFRTRPQVILIDLARASEDGPACDSVDRYVTRLNPQPVWLRWLS